VLCAVSMLRSDETFLPRLSDLAGKLSVSPHAQFFGLYAHHFEAEPEAARGRLPPLEDRRALCL